MELNKLRALLEKENIKYVNKSIVTKNDGVNIYYKDYDISVISHKYSYGGDKRTIGDNGVIYRTERKRVANG